MNNKNLDKNNQDIVKEMPINTVFPKCIQKEKDRVIMHTDMYSEDMLKDECGIM